MIFYCTSEVGSLWKIVGRFPLQFYKHDSSGLSSGGLMAWNLIQAYPPLFLACVTVASYPVFSRLAQFRTVPVWVTCGSRDTIVNRNTFERMLTNLHQFNPNLRWRFSKILPMIAGPRLTLIRIFGTG